MFLMILFFVLILIGKFILHGVVYTFIFSSKVNRIYHKIIIIIIKFVIFKAILVIGTRRITPRIESILRFVKTLWLGLPSIKSRYSKLRPYFEICMMNLITIKKKKQFKFFKTTLLIINSLGGLQC